MTRVCRVAILALALALSSSCGPAAPTDPDAAPTLTGKDLNGDYWSSLDARGKVVLVNIWATWCGPCRRELPALQAVHERFGGPEFELVGVSVDSDADDDRVREMARRHGLTYRIVLDPGKGVTVAWSVSSYPTSVLLDRKGHMVWQKRGALDSDDRELLAHIEAAVGSAE